VKQKKTQTNPRKVMQSQIHELGNATGVIFNEIGEVKRHLVGMEKLIMHLAEFLKKKDKFEKYLEVKIKEEEEAQAKLDKLKNKEYKGQEDDTYR
tara:strand:+ start:685 stop:969 length:285 start_codon:yes stop_codon:yes gene_type:complete